MSKRKIEKLGIEKLPLEELKAERESVDFDKVMKRTFTPNLTIEIVEYRLKELAREHNLDIMDPNLLVLYCEKYDHMTSEIADILCPRYGFKGIYPTPKY